MPPPPADGVGDGAGAGYPKRPAGAADGVSGGLLAAATAAGAEGAGAAAAGGAGRGWAPGATSRRVGAKGAAATAAARGCWRSSPEAPPPLALALARCPMPTPRARQTLPTTSRDAVSLKIREFKMLVDDVVSNLPRPADSTALVLGIRRLQNLGVENGGGRLFPRRAPAAPAAPAISPRRLLAVSIEGWQRNWDSRLSVRV